MTSLHDLAHRVAHLTIDRHDPEKFFCEKSEIAAELRRMARDGSAQERTQRDTSRLQKTV